MASDTKDSSVKSKDRDEKADRSEKADKGEKGERGDKSEKSDSDSKTIVGETLKKVLSVGIGAAFMTEENIRGYLGDLKLPKEILATLLQSASKGKDELTQRVSKEIIGIVSKIDWVKEIAKFAETHKFKISAEIDIIKKNNSDPKS